MITFTNVTVVNPGEPPRPGLDVTFRDGVVDCITATGGPVRQEATVIEGGFISPSFTDAHVHFGDDDMVNQITCLHYLLSGITSVFCLSGSKAILRLRDDIGSEAVLGPRMWSTGPAQNDSTMTYEDGLGEAEREADAGFDGIKIYNSVTLEGWRGLLDGAARRGLPVVGHVARAPGLESTLKSAQCHIAHVEELMYTGLNLRLEDAMQAPPNPLAASTVEPLAEQLLASGQSVGTTIEALAAAAEQVRDIDAWVRRPEFVAMPLALQHKWGPENNDYVARFKDRLHPIGLSRLSQSNLELVAHLHTMGVPLVVATDAMNCGVEPGPSLAREITHLEGAGISRADILESTMRSPIPAGGDVGCIVPGRPCDVIHTDVDVFAFDGGLPPIQGVVLGQRWLPRTLLLDQIAELTHSADTAYQASTKGNDT